MAYPSISTRVIGETEKALNAILARLLEGTSLTEPQWVILSLAIVNGGTLDRGPFTQQVADALKISPAGAQARITELIAAQHLQVTADGPAVTVASATRQLHSRICGNVAEITQRLWGDLPAEDLATAGRVLSIISERANAELGH